MSYVIYLKNVFYFIISMKNKMYTGAIWSVSVLSSVQNTVVFSINVIMYTVDDNDNCKKHGLRHSVKSWYKTAEITLLCHKVLCFCTLLALPVYKKVTVPCDIAK